MSEKLKKNLFPVILSSGEFLLFFFYSNAHVHVPIPHPGAQHHVHVSLAYWFKSIHFKQSTTQTLTTVSCNSKTMNFLFTYENLLF